MDGRIKGSKQRYLTEFNGEMHLRRIYLVLKEQGMIREGNMVADHFGSRQQCLYSCICFILMYFGVYDSDCSNVPNID